MNPARFLLPLSAALLVATAIGCSSSPGPAGPQGPAGPAGPPGTPGLNAILVDVADGGTLAFDGGLVIVAGPPGAQGPQGPAGTPTSTGISCTPDAERCDGTSIVTCTRSGTDEVFGYDCAKTFTAYSSPHNPITCVTNGCANGAGACCRSALPTCSVNLSSPSLNDAYSYPDYHGFNCTPPDDCTTSGSFSFSMSKPESSCPQSYLQIDLGLPRPLPTPGQTFTLPASGVSLYLSTGGRSCNQWSGTIVWNSEVPNWSVTVDATCTTTGKTDLVLKGTISGAK